MTIIIISEVLIIINLNLFKGNYSELPAMTHVKCQDHFKDPGYPGGSHILTVGTDTK